MNLKFDQKRCVFLASSASDSNNESDECVDSDGDYNDDENNAT